MEKSATAVRQSRNQALHGSLVLNKHTLYGQNEDFGFVFLWKTFEQVSVDVELFIFGTI